MYGEKIVPSGTIERTRVLNQYGITDQQVAKIEYYLYEEHQQPINICEILQIKGNVTKNALYKDQLSALKKVYGVNEMFVLIV